MSRIVETVLVTTGADNAPHIAPLGLTEEPGGLYSAAPFRPSRTLDNLLANGAFTASVPADPRIIAGLLTGRRDWPTVPAERIAGHRLADAVAHMEFETKRVVDEAGARPRFHARLVHHAAHAPAPPHNRAAAAIVEAAILVSRLHMLPLEKIAAERSYLQIAIDKTAGPDELEAWGWLMERIDSFTADAATAHRPAAPR